MVQARRNRSTGKSWANSTTSLSTRAMLCVGSMALAFPASVAFANPQGGVVAGGQATITQSGNTLDINQASSKAIINWNSFDVGTNEKTVFNQPSSSSIALNRVSSNNPSQILGQLDANGQVILVNPNGVFFGPHSQVNVSGLVASTANIADSDFMAGKLNFSQPGNSDASIINQGTITAKDAGLVGFVAPSVENDGVITAKLGKVTLDSGDIFTLDMAGDNLITVAVSEKLSSQLASNTGTIKADGGSVTLSAAAASGIVNSLVTNSGTIQANSVGTKNGRIVLYAAGSNAVADNDPADKGQEGGDSRVINRGTLRARGSRRNEKGGSITVTGDNVGIISGSVIDASGQAGGGTIQIGGDFHGQGTTPTALNTLVQSGVTIAADAITTGNGGNVTIWADNATEFDGSITARGGALSGDGGYVETSGHTLSAMGKVDAGAAHGNAGTWLLDPYDVTIAAGAGTDVNGGCSISAGTETCNANTGNATIYAGNINTTLSGGTNVLITTGSSGVSNGDITVNGAISENSSTTDTLTLSAYRNITFAAGVGVAATGTGRLNLILDSATGSTSGYVKLGSGTFTTNGGNIVIGGGTLIGGLPSGAAYGNSGSGHGIYLNGTTMNAGSGNITMIGYSYSGTSDTGGVYLNSATVEVTGAGNISITGTGGGTGGSNESFGVYLNGSLVESTGSQTSTSNGTITISGTGGDIGGSGFSQYGIDINGGTITSVDGNISLSGTSGSPVSGSGGNWGVNIGSAPFIVTAAAATISATGNATVTISGTSNGKGGNTNGGVYFNTSGTTVSVKNGNLSITGNGSVINPTNFDFGVQVDTGTIVETTGTGNISITGYGGGTSGNGSYQEYGVYLTGGTIESTASGAGAGSISITGYGGGNGTGSYIDYGITLGSGSVTTVDGNISLSGTGGGGNGTGGNNHGLYINTATVETTGNGSIGVTGQGGGSSADTGGSDTGVYLNTGGLIESAASGASAGTITIQGTGGDAGGSGTSNMGVWFVGGSVTSVDGNVSVTGNTSNASGGSNQGVNFKSGGNIVVSGNASISVTGTGGSGAGGGNYGVSIGGNSSGNGTISAAGGNVTINGTGGGSGTGSTNYGIILRTGSTVTTASGNISITGTDGSGSGGSNYGFFTDSTAGNKIGIGSGTTTGNISIITNDWSISTLAINTTGTVIFCAAYRQHDGGREQRGQRAEHHQYHPGRHHRRVAGDGRRDWR